MKIHYKTKHWKLNKDYNIDKILYLLIDRSDRINEYNISIWENNKGQFHREYDLPAYIDPKGHVEWCQYDKSHRKNNKPAIIDNNGYKEYYKGGILY